MGKTTKEQSRIGHERRMTRVKSGLCFTCGKPNSSCHTSIRCEQCRVKQNAARNKLRSERKENGYCACGNISLPDVFRCQKCWFEEFSIKLCGTITMVSQLKELWEAQQGLCAYTGEKLIPGKTASLDHIKPRAKGGTHEISNLQWVSKIVNYMKRDLEHEDFIRLCSLISKRGRPRKNPVA